jgi:hypothetical protein
MKRNTPLIAQRGVFIFLGLHGRGQRQNFDVFGLRPSPE